MGLVVGIDASRNRSGGALAYLTGILGEAEPVTSGIREVHLWAYRSLLDSIPDQPWLIKHAPIELEQSLASQLWWQAIVLRRELRRNRCDILYSTDASTVCRYKPMVVFSQDLLSYEPGVIRGLGFGYASLRAIAILFIQNLAFRAADGVIFLTKYAGEIIQAACGKLQRVAHIPHGVAETFRVERDLAAWPTEPSEPIRCVYVSPIMGYKHQWNAVKAIEMLRRRGHNLTLTLIGSGVGKEGARLEQQIQEFDPHGEFVVNLGHVPQHELPRLLADSHVFMFLSSCEAFGITLLEGMTLGMPIVCSDQSSLPETLQDGGVYCDPRDAVSIADSTARVISGDQLRSDLGRRAKALSDQYSWKRCAAETFEFIAKTASRNQRAG